MTIGKLDDGTMLSCEKVLHDIYARVLVLEDGTKRLVIITHDSNSTDVATPILRERCRDKLGIDPSCLIPIATHNHQAPMPRWKDNFPYQRWVAEQIFKAIQEAMSNERGPARVFFGSGYGYFVRSSGNAPVDYEIQLLKVMRENDVVALLMRRRWSWRGIYRSTSGMTTPGTVARTGSGHCSRTTVREYRFPPEPATSFAPMRGI